MLIFLTAVDRSAATGDRCSSLFRTPFLRSPWKKREFYSAEELKDPEFNKALSAILTPFRKGLIDRPTVVHELYELAKDSRAESLSLTDFENLTDRDLKSSYVFGRATLNKSLFESGLNIHDRPKSFHELIEQYRPRLRLRHSTDPKRLLAILSRMKIEPGRDAKENDSDVGAYAYAELQDPKVSYNDRHSYVIWMSTRALDRNDWSHANQPYDYGVRSENSFDPDHSFALFLELIGNGAQENEVMLPYGIDLHYLPFRIQVPTESARAALLQELKIRSISAPDGHSWKELIGYPRQH
jgi:hypothetical protein